MDFDDALYVQLRALAPTVARGLPLDELVQTAALIIVRRGLLGRWRADRGSLTAYLYVILRSAAATMRRGQYRRARSAAAFAVHTRRAYRVQRAGELRALLASPLEGPWWDRYTPLLSPDARVLLFRLLSGESRGAVRQVLGQTRETRAYREIQEVVRANPDR